MRYVTSKRWMTAMCGLLTVSLMSAADGIGIWSSVGFEKKIAKGLDAEFETEYRFQDNFKEMDRWTLGASLSYRLYRNEQKTFDVKADAGYKFIRTYNESSISLKDMDNGFQEYNEDEDYYMSKHRGTASVSAKYTTGRFTFSVRERYQFTYNDSVGVTETKYRYSSSLGDLYPKEEVLEYKSSKKKNVLRSRLEVEYDIPNFKFNPYASIEFFNDFDAKLGLDKHRYMVGGSFSVNKIHSFDVYYLYQDNQDSDEPGGSCIGIGYCYKF